MIETAPGLGHTIFGERFLDPVLRATVEATEEAIVNALFKAETMVGRDGNTRHALPLDQMEMILERYGRPREPVKHSGP